jgi:hypothetical protein
MKVRRVVLTEEPYPICAISGKSLGYFNATYEVTQADGKVVYVNYAAVNALLRKIR